MRALVTGGAGLIGSHIVDLLLARGWDVRIIDALEKPSHLFGKPAWVPADVEFIHADVLDRDSLGRALAGVDAVFHQAAYQGFLPSFSRFWHVNGGGTALIFELIVEQRIPVRKVVIASSQAVYGEGTYRCSAHGIGRPGPRLLADLAIGTWEQPCAVCGEPMEPVPTDEVHLDPRTMYAQTKRAQETIALELGRLHGIPTVALRYAITQGPRQSIYHAYSGVCSIFATRVLAGQRPVVYEDGRQLRDYVFVGDVARANLWALDTAGADYDVFNVGTGISTSVLDFLRALGAALGQEVEPEMSGAFRLGDIRHFRCDISKIRRLGWSPSISLQETLARYVAWIRQQGEIRDYFATAEAEMKRLGVIRASRAAAQHA